MFSINLVQMLRKILSTHRYYTYSELNKQMTFQNPNLTSSHILSDHM